MEKKSLPDIIDHMHMRLDREPAEFLYVPRYTIELLLAAAEQIVVDK